MERDQKTKKSNAYLRSQQITRHYTSKARRRKILNKKKAKQFQNEWLERKQLIDYEFLNKKEWEIIHSVLDQLHIPIVLIQIIMLFSINSYCYFKKCISSFNICYGQHDLVLSNQQLREIFLIRIPFPTGYFHFSEQFIFVSATLEKSSNIPRIIKYPSLRNFVRSNFNKHSQRNIPCHIVFLDGFILYIVQFPTIYCIDLNSVTEPPIYSEFTLDLQFTSNYNDENDPYLRSLTLHFYQASVEGVYVKCDKTKNLFLFSLKNGKLLNEFLLPNDIIFLYDVATNDNSDDLYLLVNDKKKRILVLNKNTKDFKYDFDYEWKIIYEKRRNEYQELKYKLKNPVSLLSHSNFLYINDQNKIEIYSTNVDTYGKWVITLFEQPERDIENLKMALGKDILFVTFLNRTNIQGRLHIYSY